MIFIIAINVNITESHNKRALIYVIKSEYPI